jgi:tRNA(fMet)-specific endonuclease VapC
LKYLLDSNAWIAYLRLSDPGLLSQIKAHDSGDLALCSIVVAELCYGVERSQAARRAANWQLVEILRSEFVSLPFDDVTAELAGRVRAELAALGTPIGANDLMIAAVALAGDLTLVTHNTREFGRVPGLRLEDWQTM